MADLAGDRRTAPRSDFSRAIAAAIARRPAADAAVGDDPARSPPILTTPDLGQRLGTGTANRYAVGRLLGAGGIGRVLQVEDRNLHRDIALKTPLPWLTSDAAAIEAFVAEARITSSLEHPGIVPVHDLDLSADGQIFYAMRRVHGRSLGAAVDEALDTGVRPAAIATPNDIVTLLLKACDPLAYAHHRGVVHLDLKPDNIMLGDFGEVLVLDWGSSSSGEHGGGPGSDHFGTPAFMSPEQARVEPTDARSDVYSLGATLFQTLFLRLPLDAPDAASLLARKRDGELDPPLPHELDAHNRPLAAIALRAMAADPAERYQSVQAMAADLRAYQAGQSVAAYRSPWHERMLRWLRRWWRVLATVGACAASLLIAVWLVWGERLKEVATWGAPVITEKFSDATWSTRWECSPTNAFALQNGRLVTTAPNPAMARFGQLFAGPVAIEYDAEMTSGSRAGDLSVVWWDGEQQLDATHKPADGWLLQVGAFDNTCCAIYRTHADTLDQVARRSLRLESGRVYRIREEIDGARLTLSVDGVVMLTYEDLFPVRPGHLGLYGYYPGKAFDNLRIYTKGVPERLSPIALGDDYAQEGDLRRAIDRYHRVAVSHPDGPLADQAWFKIGHCLLQLGDEGGAWQAWDKVDGEPFARRVALRALDRSFTAGRHDEVLQRLPGLADGTTDQRSQAEALWSDCSSRLVERLPTEPQLRPVLERYLELRRQVFPGMGASITAYGQALNHLGHWQQAVDECGDDAVAVTSALRHLGLPAEAERRFGLLNWTAHDLYRETGNLQALADAEHKLRRNEALAKLDCTGQAMAESGPLPPRRILAAVGDWRRLLDWQPNDEYDTLALLATGRAQAAVDGANRTPPMRSRLALLLFGRQAEAEALGTDGVDNLDSLRLLAALSSGDQERASTWRAAVAAQPIDWISPNAWFGSYVILPLLATHEGDSSAWQRALDRSLAVRERAGQRLWHLAAFVDGRIDAKTLLAQPFKAEAGAWLRLGEGLRAERGGNAAQARVAYTAFQALPLDRRLIEGFQLSPVVERFVAWRLLELNRP